MCQATTFGSKCVQLGMFGEDAGKPVGDEDCLLLNVYVPVSDSTSPKGDIANMYMYIFSLILSIAEGGGA